jgi:hypothetical protein
VPEPLYYGVTALPVLGELGSTPPLQLPELMEMVRGVTAADLVAAILLADDLLQRDACLAGELPEPVPSVLSPGQVRGQEALPDYLDTVEHAGEMVPGDSTWAAYYHHAAALAEERDSAFLREWVGIEVGLRNGLAQARARALNLDPAGYIIAPDLGRDAAAVDDVVAEWSGAHDPLEGLEILLESRWRWVHDHDAWFSFGPDELAAYAAKLLLLHRWTRISPAAGSAHHDTADERVKR